MARSSMRPHTDLRFEALGVQPRANQLGRKVKAIASGNPDFAEALRHRMKDPQRFEAFMEGKTTYLCPDNPCSKCGGTRRVVRDRRCHACVIRKRAEGFAILKKQKQERRRHGKPAGALADSDAGTRQPESEAPPRDLFQEIFPDSLTGLAA